jgi:pyruvate,orthophosphate dikinase
MKKNIHFFSANEHISKKAVLDNIGLRGRRAMELAALDLPILPGFIFDSEVAANLEEIDIKTYLKPFIARIEKITGKKFGDKDNPMLVKIVISPNLVIVNYPTLHNFGLVNSNVDAFKQYVGENFGYHEMQFLMKGCLEIEAKIAELESREDDKKKIEAAIAVLEKELKAEISVAQRKQTIAKFTPLLPKGFFSEPYAQLEIALKRISRMLRLDEMDDRDR